MEGGLEEDPTPRGDEDGEEHRDMEGESPERLLKDDSEDRVAHDTSLPSTRGFGPAEEDDPIDETRHNKCSNITFREECRRRKL